MSDLILVKRALISVSDKSGLADFAKALVSEFGVDLISTGGTAKFLREQGLKVTDVSQVTGFPEMMDGRVKTLHPKIHGGLLALRDNVEHMKSAADHGIEPIDLVVINLYPFEKTIAKPGVHLEEAIENIDIGGPSMVRSAAKNHRFVLVVTEPDRYEKVLGDLRKHGGSSCGEHRLKQAQRAFAHTAAYDAKIADYLTLHVAPSPSGASGSGPARSVREPHQGSVATIAPASARFEPATSSLVQRLADCSASLDTFLKDLLNTMAVCVGGTEAAAFTVEAKQDLRLALHIRPDDSTEHVRAAAVQAFSEIILPCLQENKDGAIEVGSPDGGDPQFCLVTLLRQNGEPTAACAVIARAKNPEEAGNRLRTLQICAGYYDLYLLKREQVQHDAENSEAGLPATLVLNLKKRQELRYGENPHQKAALYLDTQPKEASVAYAKQLHGKELSYINLLDADAALAAVKEFAQPAACVVKHATPCGYATGSDIATAFKRAYEGDPLAAFGGIVALNKPVDLAAAKAITDIDKLLEVIVAPSYAPDALELLRTRWKNVRLLEVGTVEGFKIADSGFSGGHHMHVITGGYLVQERDLTGFDRAKAKVVSKRPPTDAEWADLEVAWLACKHLKSNAIALAKGGMMVGGGAGQQDRVNACRIAVAKAGDRSRGAVAGSDAFFPFPDGPKLLLEAGITAIIHPGGSVRDGESLAVVDEAGAAMVLTGERHFKH